MFRGRKPAAWMVRFALVFLLAARAAGAELSTDAPAVGQTNSLTLRQTLQRVLAYNESLQMHLLDLEISNRTFRAEHGIFEPQIYGTAEYTDSHKPNNAQERARLTASAPGSLIAYNERNLTYETGIEWLVPTGGKLKLGASIHDLHNNLQNSTPLFSSAKAPNFQHEYETFVGATLVQPILKNFGPRATMIRIRLAALASDMAYQEYRRQLMITVARSEATYWDLFLTQEQERVSNESVGVAESILSDNRNRLGVGKSAELEVLQSQAGVAERQARMSESHRKWIEGSTQLSTLLSDGFSMTNATLRAVDSPQISELPTDRVELFQKAFDSNPDYQTRRQQVKQQNILLAYAQNQRLPQLDLKGSYGLNGLGLSVDDSYGQIDHSRYTAWTFGAELHVPLFGGIRERNELSAAQLSQKRALLGLKELETQIYSAVEGALQKAVSLRDNVRSYGTVIDFHQKLLQSQLDALHVGKLDSRTVLETESKLSDAKIFALDNLVQFQKALLELELATGTVLQSRNLDMTKSQLEVKTVEMIERGRWSPSQLRKYAEDANRDFEEGRAGHYRSSSNPDQEKAINSLRQKIEQSAPVEATPEQGRAIEALRKLLGEPAPNSATPTNTPAQQNAIDALHQKIKDQNEEEFLPK